MLREAKTTKKMTDFNFSVIISIIMISMILILAMSIRLQLTVKARKVTKSCGKYALSAYKKPGKVILGDRVVVPSWLEEIKTIPQNRNRVLFGYSLMEIGNVMNQGFKWNDCTVDFL